MFLKVFFYSVAKNLAIDADRQRSHLEQFDDDQHSLIYEGQISLRRKTQAELKEIIETLMEKVENPNDRDLTLLVSCRRVHILNRCPSVLLVTSLCPSKTGDRKSGKLVQSGGL